MTTHLQFVTPPPGLAPHKDFELDRISDETALYALRALEDESVRLFLVDPATVVPDYAPTLSDDQVSALSLTGAEDALVFVVARVTEEGVGVNLLAPVVVNRHSGVAQQVILEGQNLPILAPLS